MNLQLIIKRDSLEAVSLFQRCLLRIHVAAVGTLLLAGSVISAPAQATSELEQLKTAVKSMEQTIEELKLKIQALEQQQKEMPAPFTLPEITTKTSAISDRDNLNNQQT